MTFQAAVADVLAFHAGEGGEHGEGDAGGVVRALEFASEEFQRTPEARSSRARATAFSSSGRRVARVVIFSEKIRVTPASVRESIWVSRDWRAAPMKHRVPRGWWWTSLGS
ncbi:hypothetical protein Misp03_15890 [Microbispora sp. NBRC 16548]|nr:hypothetical protein Misp03_15890 [Microbispora sp. NBRC 16548]